MSDELVKRLRGDWCGYEVSLKAIDAMTEAADRIEQLTAERERLALAICGGEDAPGYANAQTVETLEHVARQNQQSHGETINSLLAAEAERDRLREALDNLLEALTAEDQFRDRAMRIVGPKPNLQWLLEAEDDARAALKGESHE